MRQEDIAVMFRKTELKVREERRARLLALLKNEGELYYEQLTPAEAKVHDRAVAEIKVQNILHIRQTEARLGYWKRLWYALTNKRV